MGGRAGVSTWKSSCSWFADCTLPGYRDERNEFRSGASHTDETDLAGVLGLGVAYANGSSIGSGADWSKLSDGSE